MIYSSDNHSLMKIMLAKVGIASVPSIPSVKYWEGRDINIQPKPHNQNTYIIDKITCNKHKLDCYFVTYF